MGLTQTTNVDASGNTIISGAVTGPVTDTQIRATPLPVSGPLTDTQIRATALPVSGPLTDTQIRATALPVSGPLTDTQLRATPVAVTAATSATGTITSVAGSATSVSILSANAARKGFTVYNDSTAIAKIAFAATASATAFTVLLQPNSFYENNTLYTGVISAIWASAAGSARVTELT